MVATVQLPANATYRCRTVTFIRASELGAPVVGVVEIRECRKPNGAAKCSRYAIREDSETGAADLHLRFTKPGGGEVYNVCVPAGPDEFPVCECTAYLQYSECKHIQTAVKLDAAGHFSLPSYES